MKKYIKAVDTAENLNSLCEALNKFEEHIKELNSNDPDDIKSIGDYIDLCDLKTFGKEPIDTMEIFSWDEVECMVQNTCLEGNDWVIIERTIDFGQ